MKEKRKRNLLEIKKQQEELKETLKPFAFLSLMWVIILTMIYLMTNHGVILMNVLETLFVIVFVIVAVLLFLNVTLFLWNAYIIRKIESERE